MSKRFTMWKRICKFCGIKSVSDSYTKTNTDGKAYGLGRGYFNADWTFNFDFIEQSVLSQSSGFGNPHSKWTQHEQFLLWKKMIQSGRFQSRDEYCNTLVEYSTYQQALEALNLGD